MAGDAVGIIGSGALGGAIARGLLDAGAVEAGKLWLANRSGARTGFEAWPDLRFTTENQDAADNCAIVILAVPPATVGEIGISAEDRLVISVMAGVSARRIAALTGAPRVVRAMSNPAADRRLAYSPWWAGPGVTAADKRTVAALFGAIGPTDEVREEDHIDRFTAITGPVPGFVAYFAQCMADYAVRHGIPQDVADRAVRQLFLASGAILGEEDTPPSAQVQAMIDYAGTTAAGIEAMIDSPLSESVAKGLDAAYGRAKAMG